MTIRAYTVHICDDCYNLVGEMCCEPGCAFCYVPMADIRATLHYTLIRPVVDGEPLDMGPPDGDVVATSAQETAR